MYGAQSRKRKVYEQVVPAIGEVPGAAPHRTSTDSGYSPQTGNPFDNADYPIPDFQRVYNLMRDPNQGLKVEDRRWRLVSYTRCFVGKEAVQWMMDNLGFDRPTSISTGQRLMEAGILHHVTHSEPFGDEYYFYRFQEDDDTNILNMKRVWDSAIPTRHAVLVSKDLLTRLALLCEEYRKGVLAGKQLAQASPSPAIGTKSTAVPAPTTPSLPKTPPAPAGFAAMLSPSLTRSFSAPPPTSQPLMRNSPLIPSTPPIIGGTRSSSFTATRSYAVGDDVDYTALAKSEAFRQYTLQAAELQRVQLVALNQDERIAFFVNCYNLLCLHGYVSHGQPNNMLRRYNFFRGLSYRIAGLDMTLDDIEHGILRGNKRAPMIRFMQQLRPSDPKCHHVLRQRDGRIHFVISAGTKSDPPIRILDGENVREELHDATIEFLSYSVKVDMEKKEVTLPRIFLWYAEDFPTPEKNLLGWVARYLPTETSHQLVSLLSASETPPTIIHENFDWSSPEARFNASVVRRKRRRLEREKLDAEQGALGIAGDGMSPFLSGRIFEGGESQKLHNLLAEATPIPALGGTGTVPGALAALLPAIGDSRPPNNGIDSESAAISNASKTNGTKEDTEDKSKTAQRSESTSENA